MGEMTIGMTADYLETMVDPDAWTKRQTEWFVDEAEGDTQSDEN